MEQLTNRERRLKALLGNEFFEPFSEEEVGAIMERGKFKTFSPFKQVVKQGEEGKSFFIILDGRANVMKTSKAGKKKIIATIREGECFGEMALLLKRVRSATVITELESEVLEIKREALESFNSSIREKLFHVFAVTLSKRLKEMTTWKPDISETE